MKQSILTAAAVFATNVWALGSVQLQNNCDHPLYLQNTPSVGQSIYKTLDANNGYYSQQYQQLSNGAGWSLKVSKTGDTWNSHITQWEYTYQGDASIWYDVSDVDGSALDTDDWYISADNPSCKPKQTKYRFSTDDKNGMQDACDCEVSIKLTFCPNGNSNSNSDAPASSAPASSAPASSAAPVSSAPSYKPAVKQVANPSPAPVSVSQAASGSSSPALMMGDGHVGNVQGPTTMVTHVVTAYATETEIATVMVKRHEHHKRASA